MATKTHPIDDITRRPGCYEAAGCPLKQGYSPYFVNYALDVLVMDSAREPHKLSPTEVHEMTVTYGPFRLANLREMMQYV